MAGKEATLVLLDVGSSMYQQYQGTKNKLRRIDLSIDCLQLMLQNKIFNYKNHEIGLILFGAENAPDGKTLYIQEISKPDLEFIRNVGELANHEEAQLAGGDIFDALDKAVHTLDEYAGTKKFEKKIFVLTSGSGQTEYREKDIQKLVRMIEKVDVKINFIALDFLNEYDPALDDPEQPEKIELLNNRILTAAYPSQELSLNSRYVFLMVQDLRNNMRIFPAHVAFELYSQFHTKNVSARASFRGDFMLNDENSIQVLIFKRTAEERLPSLKKHSTLGTFYKEPQSNSITNDSVFYIHDDPTMAPVDKEFMIKGYSYGRKIVPIDSLMEEKMKYQCPRSFQLLGFVDKSTIPRHYYMGSVDMVVAVDSEKAQKQLSAVITALIATKKLAIARFVGREKSSPKLMVLIPHKSSSYECFWMISLPTAEDIRHFQFASLKKSTPQQQHAVGQLIDAMDLERIPNESGQPEEILKMKCIANPTRQYYQQVVMHKAITQTDVVPEISPIILEYLHPEERVYNMCKDLISKLKVAFKFKKHEIKKSQDKKVFWKQLFEQESNTQQMEQNEEVVEINQEEEEMVAALSKQKYGFNDEILKVIGTVNPLEDFKKMITEKRADLVDSALNQIQSIIRRLIDESVRGSFYEKALECLKEMRRACISEDEPKVFNEFLVMMKDKYNQTVFWASVVKEGITLISIVENSTSAISVDEAQDFLNREDDKNKILVDQLQDDEENLLDEIE